jgi:hypothetical protein
MDFGPSPEKNTEPTNENEPLPKEKISPLRLPTQMSSSDESSVSSEEAEWDGDLNQKPPAVKPIEDPVEVSPPEEVVSLVDPSMGRGNKMVSDLSFSTINYYYR